MKISSLTKRNKKYIIFDMDGTLYELEGGSYYKSKLAKEVKKNALLFIVDQLKTDKIQALKILDEIKNDYGENISVGLEEMFKINRFKYFENVWNIKAKGIVKQNKHLVKMLKNLMNKYIFILISDSPRCWIDNVLKELQITDFFKDKIFSGESNKRKIYKNYINNIVKELKINPNDCFIVGDQEETDIVPAKKIGITTIFINKNNVLSVADYSVNNILNINTIL